MLDKIFQASSGILEAFQVQIIVGLHESFRVMHLPWKVVEFEMLEPWIVRILIQKMLGYM